MELKELINIYTKEKNLIVGLMFIGLIVATVVYMLPEKYVTDGSFIVTRNTQKSGDFFTYEGYYAQQTAVGYANTVEPLMLSVDVMKKALETIGVAPTLTNLRKLEKDTRVSREGAQLINLRVKDNNPEISRQRWDAIAQSAIDLSKDSNSRNGDSELNIISISQEPITKQVYRSLYVYLATGLLVGLFFGIAKVSSDRYLK